jgi:hypothetical protein
MRLWHITAHEQRLFSIELCWDGYEWCQHGRRVAACSRR